MRLCSRVWRLLWMMKKQTKFSVFSLLCVVLVCLCASGFAQEITLNGCAYVDDNGNALCDAGENLIAGVPVTLERRTADSWETAAELVTDAYGQYAFEALAEGEYRLLCTLNDPSFYAASFGASQQHADGALVLEGLTASATADIGLRPAALLTAEAYWDSSADGERGKFERDLAGVNVEILHGEDVLAAGTTGKKGSVTLSAAPGEHVLRVTLPDGYAYTVLGADNCVAGEEAVAVSEPLLLTAGQTAHASIAARPVGSFSGKAFEDMNNNGVMDEGEPGAAGVTVYLAGKRTGTARAIITDESGEYCFERLPDDLYTVTADLPDGMLYARYSKTGGDLRSIFTGSTLAREFSVKSAAHVENKNIGVVQKGVIHGTAFFDLNYNGLMDEGETGYAGVTVEAIKLSNNDSMGKCVTDENGAFRLENLRGGDYRLRAILPEDGSIFSVTAQGAADQANLFEQSGTRRESSVQPLSIVSGGEAVALIGVARGASVRGTVFQDADYNGRLNGKEKVITGVKVRAIDENGNIAATDTTGKKGQYLLSGLMPGKYTIEVQRKGDFGFTRLRPNEKDGSFVAALVGDWGVTEPIEIAMAQEITGVNAGMLPAATVSGSFFHDVNDNGLWDTDELGMLSAQVRLLSEDGEIDLVLTPKEDGSYFFDGVMPGKYTLTYLLPEHAEMARTASGGNTVKHAGAETAVSSIKVEMGKAYAMPLAGAVTLGSFEGVVFNDSNANGVQDAGEQPLSGASITVKNLSGDASEAVSSADGSFSITGLRPDEYRLVMELPDGYIFSHDLSQDGLVLDASASQSIVCPWAALISRTDKLVGAVNPASLSGQIWMDENQNACQDEGEWIMEGLKLRLVDEATGASIASIVSDSHGFTFENVRPGHYTVCFDLPDQSTPAGDAAATFRLNGSTMEQRGVQVAEGQQLNGLTAGLVSRTSIGGTAWLDENGQRTPVEGVTVALSMNGSVLMTAVTDANGAYRFDGLWPAEYVITASIPQNMIFARPDDPNYEQGESVIQNAQQGESGVIRLLMAQHQLKSDLIYIKPAKLGDLAWLDENRNGLLDGGEPRLSGVSVSLVQNGQAVYETVTDDYGYYLFGDIYPGQYVLSASAWPQVAPTKPVESLRIISSCLTSGDGTLAQSETFELLSGQSDMNYDLGYLLLDGQTLPEGAEASAPSRDWTLTHRPKE